MGKLKDTNIMTNEEFAIIKANIHAYRMKEKTKSAYWLWNAFKRKAYEASHGLYEFSELSIRERRKRADLLYNGLERAGRLYKRLEQKYPFL